MVGRRTPYSRLIEFPLLAEEPELDTPPVTDVCDTVAYRFPIDSQVLSRQDREQEGPHV
jgi:hypothetical protein